MEENEFL